MVLLVRLCNFSHYFCLVHFYLNIASWIVICDFSSSIYLSSIMNNNRPSNQSISFTLSCGFMWPQRRVWLQDKSYLMENCSISSLGEQNRFQSSQDNLAGDNSKKEKELNVTRKEKPEIDVPCAYGFVFIMWTLVFIPLLN